MSTFRDIGINIKQRDSFNPFGPNVDIERCQDAEDLLKALYQGDLVFLQVTPDNDDTDITIIELQIGPILIELTFTKTDSGYSIHVVLYLSIFGIKTEFYEFTIDINTNVNNGTVSVCECFNVLGIASGCLCIVYSGDDQTFYLDYNLKTFAGNWEGRIKLFTV